MVGLAFRIEWRDGQIFMVCSECCPTPNAIEYTVTAIDLDHEAIRYEETST
jgi:hypothetical protein